MSLSPADQFAILQLLYSYSHRLDSGDAEGWASLFTDDGEFVEPEGTQRGRRELVAMVHAHHRDHEGAAKSQHWVHSPVITGDDDHAEVLAYVIVFQAGDRLDVRGRVMGSYRDELVRDADRGWLFKRRIVLRPHQSEFART